MTAATKNRNTPQRLHGRRGYPVAAAAICFAGTIAVQNASGFCQPASTATGLIPLGRFAKYIDNSAGANGDVQVEVESGVFYFANDADAVVAADVGKVCYLVDDQTVAKTDGTGTRSVAGIVDEVDANGVWVSMGPQYGATAYTAN